MTARVPKVGAIPELSVLWIVPDVANVEGPVMPDGVSSDDIPSTADNNQ